MNADEELAALLEQVTLQQQNGLQPDFDALGRQHPQWIDELRQLVQVAELANQLGSAVTRSQTTTPVPRAPTMPLAPLGESFDGYELLGEIGRGAMGVVYKAWDPQLQRVVALKMILGGEHASAIDLARFRTEAQAAARLAHRNIVSVYQVGDCAGRPYFSMQYVEGTTLADLAHKGPLDQRKAARLVKPDCERGASCPPARDSAPRSETGQRADRQGGATCHHRLWPGQTCLDGLQ